MSQSYADQIKERLQSLEVFKIQEKALPNPSQLYLDDLELSIKQCKTSLKKYPSGYEMVK